MTKSHRGKQHPIAGEIELSLSPGAFISYYAMSSFVEDLEAVASKLSSFRQENASAAVRLYETFLAGCYEKADEIDDSDGDFGEFVGTLFCDWIRASQVAGADAKDTAIALLAWMDDDPYGFTIDIEKEASKTFDKAGLSAFAKQVRMRFDEAGELKIDNASRNRSEHQRRRWANVLRSIYSAQNDIAAYCALADETGTTPDDCIAIAGILARRRKNAEALAWVERGLDIEGKSGNGSAAHDLRKLKNELLRKLGRESELIEAIWNEYRQHPEIYDYGDLMKAVPKDQKEAWHEKAMEAALESAGSDLGSIAELLLKVKEIDKLSELLDRTTDDVLEGLSHFYAEPVAKKLEKTHPDIAARLWRAQGLRILEKGKSKYYGVAVEDFERAKHCYERAGLAADWEKTVGQVRAEHSRKKGFLSDFDDIVKGKGGIAEPSFLERAESRWIKRDGEDGR